MHTTYCNHARGEPRDYAAKAVEVGLKGIIFTCHNPTEGDKIAPKTRMRYAEFQRYIDDVMAVQREFDGQLDVRLGLECDYAPGQERWLERLLGQADFDYVLGSIHPQLDYYEDAYRVNGTADFQRTYFDHLAKSAETRLFDGLSHPDLIKDVLPKRQWRIRDLMPTIEKALDRIAKTGVAMELNTSGLLRVFREVSPAPQILAAMSERGIPVVLGSDAHSPDRVGADFMSALNQLQGVRYSHVSYFIERKRQEVPITAARSSLLDA